MKTQINIKKEIFLVLSILLTTVTWGNQVNPQENIDLEESKTAITYEDLFINAIEFAKAMLLNNTDEDESTDDISYELDMSTNVELNVYQGPKLIIRLVEAFQNKGEHTVKWNTSTLPQGEYTVVLVTEYGTFTQTLRKQFSNSSLRF